jgi:hypothetical protein
LHWLDPRRCQSPQSRHYLEDNPWPKRNSMKKRRLGF